MWSEPRALHSQDYRGLGYQLISFVKKLSKKSLLPNVTFLWENSKYVLGGCYVLCSFNHWLSNEQTFNQNCKRFRELLASVLRRDESEAVDQFSIYPKAVTPLTINISGWDIFWKLKTTLYSAIEDFFLIKKKTEQFSFSRTLWTYKRRQLLLSG